MRARNRNVYRVVCPRCAHVFLLLVLGEDELVTCPRCRERVLPDEEELVDPEDE
ncbi:MAG: hypothetical protein QN183_12495 [Armatimonadota bacterium]|nr:hypothetical protein [Armatimonadota bacterium]MDR7485292.1 hypothetical protein [Armatimonadota bacterium]MDR7533870.1 hypothetical protein [Armatimonadota bacterium]MDR7537168.1 hypothetical protein [Armatimonadota bacterium]